jgi:hypothetical protein
MNSTLDSRYAIIKQPLRILQKSFSLLFYRLGKVTMQGLSELADQNNTVKSSSSGNNRKNILKNPSSWDFKIRTLLIDQSRVDIKLP